MWWWQSRKQEMSAAKAKCGQNSYHSNGRSYSAAERMWDGAREVAGSTRDAEAQWVSESSSLTPKPMLVQQWFSNASVHQTRLEGLLRHSLQNPASRVFYSVGQRWDQRICIFLNSQVVLPMLLQETHFENCWLTYTYTMVSGWGFPR